MEEVKNVPSPGDSAEKKQSGELFLRKVPGEGLKCTNQHPSQPSLIREGASYPLYRWEKAEFLSERSELRNSGEGLKYNNQHPSQPSLFREWVSFPLYLWERAEFLSERSELRNSGEGFECNKQHPSQPSLIREGVSYPNSGEGLRFAFTLAEVLITIGVIGVVAAMTMPVLMTAFAKHRVETKIVKFYSMINQTVRMSVADNESPEGWITKIKHFSYVENVEFLKTYIFPYLKVSDYKQCSMASNTGTVCITNLDGTFWQFYIDGNGGDIIYYIDGDTSHKNPRNRFTFQIAKYTSDKSDRSLNSQNFVEPYVFQWDGTKEGLKNNIRGCYKGCTSCALCTKMIQLNSWKIPNDYPW